MSSIALTEELILSKNKTSSLASVKNINFWGLEIENVDILRDMPNLEVISLSVNKINSLIKFSTCSKLTELYLRKNSISDLREVKHLCCLSNLKILWLLDNPCSECIVYRVYIIKLLPNLLKLDNTGVSLDEKKESSEYDLDKLEEIVGKFMRQKNYRDPEVSEPKIQKAVSYDQYEIVKPSKSKKTKIKFEENKKSDNLNDKEETNKNNANFEEREPSKSKNENILLAIVTLINELDESGLEIIKIDIQKKLNTIRKKNNYYT